MRQDWDKIGTRFNFCSWFKAKQATNPCFPRRIMFTDEAAFHVNRTFNKQNVLKVLKDNMT